MAFLAVNGVAGKTPSKCEWGLQDISASDSGRTQDAMMHKNRIAQKRTLKLAWNAPIPADAAAILQAFNPEYVSVTYHDPMDNAMETRTFYVGDRSSPFKQWFAGGKRFDSVSFDIIER